ncbi:hypothetical protein Sango_2693700 [Sesamum angolense]|uniref:Gag-asp_proteas domain-containing protein n=1 Tax=Sesamum angolense TaxID=2727404 RepID=A0AAE2BHK7_9LAMI|nr:hypothetical protein Sango_2693700 [Sesamum angolense]
MHWRSSRIRHRPRNLLSHDQLRVARMIRERKRKTWVPSLNGATRCPIRWRKEDDATRAGKTAPVLTGSHTEEQAQPRNPWNKWLMFVDVKIHGKPVHAMIDTGATHNYLARAEVERLGLVLEKGVGRVKAINSAAQPIAGVAKSVLIKVGPFEGKTNLSVMVMDDFKLILGLEFFRDTCTAVLPHVDSLMMLEAKPCIIPTLAGRNGEKNLSAMQFEKGRKRNEPSYLCTLCFEEIEQALGSSLA